MRNRPSSAIQHMRNSTPSVPSPSRRTATIMHLSRNRPKNTSPLPPSLPPTVARFMNPRSQTSSVPEPANLQGPCIDNPTHSATRSHLLTYPKNRGFRLQSLPNLCSFGNPKRCIFTYLGLMQEFRRATLPRLWGFRWELSFGLNIPPKISLDGVLVTSACQCTYT